MYPKSTLSRIAAVASGFAAWSISSIALGGEIRVTGDSCTGTVHVVAHDARLSDVLKKLAQALDFQLSFESQNDPLISTDITRAPTDLAAWLAPLENTSVTSASNPRCPERGRIVKMWVLSKSAASATLVRQSAQADAAAEEARRQQGINQILNAHGVPTPQPAKENAENSD
jgi:hypothetical protein